MADRLIALTFAIFLALPAAGWAEAPVPPAELAPAVVKDICNYLKDIESKTDEACAPEALTALKKQDAAAFTQKLALVQKRKTDVQAAYDFLKALRPDGAAPPQARTSAAQPGPDPLHLEPPINDRTFPAWIGADAADFKAVYARWLKTQNAELEHEQQNSASDERRKEIAAKLAQNESRLARLDKIKDPTELSCFLGEGCGTRGEVSGPSVAATGTGRAWTADDFERANEQGRTQTLVPGGKIEGEVPGLGAIGSEVVANTPLGPLAGPPADKTSDPVKTARNLALETTGALLLFLGLGGGQLEEKYPGIRKNMGIAAAAGGVVAVVAMAHPRILASAIPAAANPQAEEEATEVLPSGQPVIQRVAQAAPKVTPQGEAAVEQTASQVATQAGRLLNADQAQIDIRKFTEYALNPTHRVGMHKAKVFESALGYTQENYQGLVDQIRAGLTTNPAIRGIVDKFGTHFTVDILVRGPAGQAVVRTGWIYAPGSQVPAMTTAFVR